MCGHGVPSWASGKPSSARPGPPDGFARRAGGREAEPVVDTEALHQPIEINGCVIRNRLYRAPVLEGAGSSPDAPSIYAEAFGANSKAGVGLIIQGNSCITEEGRSSPGMTLV